MVYLTSMGCLSSMESLSSMWCLSSMEFEIARFLPKEFHYLLK